MIRVLLHPEAGRRAIDDFAKKAGLSLVNLLAPRAGRPRHIVFAAPGQPGLVSFIEDYRIGARYVVIDGLDPSPLEAKIRDALPTVSLDEVLALAEEPGRRAQAISWLGVVGETPPGPRTKALIDEALASGDEALEAAAHFAIEAAGWNG